MRYKCQGGQTLCPNLTCQVCTEASCEYLRPYWSLENIDEQGNFIDPRFIFKSRDMIIKFICSKSGHVSTRSISSVYNGVKRNRKICTGPCCSSSSRLCDNISCKVCEENSCEYLRPYWTLNNRDENGNFINPRLINNTSKMTCEFKCLISNHVFKRPILGVYNSIQNGYKVCIYPCCNKEKNNLCFDIECEFCKNASLASVPNIYLYWSIKNGIDPRQIPRCSNEFYLYECYKSNHTCRRTGNSIDTNICLYPCCNDHSPKLCDDINCEICKDHSCEYLRSYWDPEFNNINPRMISIGSDQYCYLICENKHNFKISGSNLLQNKWCPYCRNKTEQLIYDFLCNEFGKENIRRQVRIIEDTTYSFDFELIINGIKIIIECDGQQHFIILKRVKRYNKSNEIYLQRDIFKMEQIRNTHSIIRLFQPDVYENKYHWHNFIRKTVIFIRMYKEPKTYISKCKNELYIHHIKGSKSEDDKYLNGFQTIMF